VRILLKYPTRGRPEQFLKTLSGWIWMAATPGEISVLVSCDGDDLSMSDAVLSEATKIHAPLTAVRSRNLTKIAACNADLKSYQNPWDVVLLISDDMFCRQSNWDGILKRAMTTQFPDTNGALWFFDGQQKNINTLECVGRKRYERFGYLYHPSYASFFCDNESTEVGLRDRKLFWIENPICSHEHPHWGRGMKMDPTYERNDQWWKQDEKNYLARKLFNFPFAIDG
jgi:hypothetical protein